MNYLQSDDLPSIEHFNSLMDRYTTDQLVNISPEDFFEQIQLLVQDKHPDFEHFTDIEIQRTVSVKFEWGHNHDFGPFKIGGLMGDRHLKHMAVFKDHFGQNFDDLHGLSILDIGCWTGGVSLLLAALGANVTSIDEVGKYTKAVNLLAEVFGMPNLEARNESLYRLTTPEWQDKFDKVFFAGVLYHLTDPIVALRIIFNSLKDGGVCLVESTGITANGAVLGYERRKYNWFDPSPAALEQLMQDVGFTDIQVGPVIPGGRLYAVGTRAHHKDMRRDGLSRPDLR